MAKSDFPAHTTGFDTPDQKPLKSGFYTRWSQRKARYLRETTAHKNHDQSLAVKSIQQADTPANTRVDDSTEHELPPVETLDEHSDLSDFMCDHVAEELRLLALRKVFHTPRFNVCDGLDDYAENYRNFEPLGDIITADIRHHLERLEQKKAADEGNAPMVEANANEAKSNETQSLVTNTTSDEEEEHGDELASLHAHSAQTLDEPKRSE